MIICQDVVEWAREYKGEKFHAMLTDCPYELGFMGKDWDKTGITFNPATWRALAEHLHDGAFIMAFASARGWHRQAVAIEDAGLIMHPTVFMFGWGYGSGFPKATRIDTQVDAMAGVEQIDTGIISPLSRPNVQTDLYKSGKIGKNFTIKKPATELARAWVGHRYGLQALKPALEPILVFQKHYSGRPVECIATTGAGALNIDGGRIGCGTEHFRGIVGKKITESDWKNKSGFGKEFKASDNPLGRWPGNLVLSHHPDCKETEEKILIKGQKAGNRTRTFGQEQEPISGGEGSGGVMDEPDTYSNKWDCVPDCPVRRLGEQSGRSKSSGGKSGHAGAYQGGFKEEFYGDTQPGLGDEGTAARFFFNADYVLEKLENADPVIYQAKASRAERDAGLEHLKEGEPKRWNKGGEWTDDTTLARNTHPTLKPIKLAQHLATLLLPPKEYAPRRILIPFAGVGSEIIGALLAGWEEIIGIEKEAEYVKIAEARVDFWTRRKKAENAQGELF